MKMWSSEKVRRLTKPGICVALDDDGHVCDEPGEFEGVYFGDDGLGQKADWVVVILCQTHGENLHREWEVNLPYRRWAKLKKAGKIRFKTR